MSTATATPILTKELAAKKPMPQGRKRESSASRLALTVFLTLLSVVYMVPLLFILLNSFKGKFYISDSPF